MKLWHELTLHITNSWHPKQSSLHIILYHIIHIKFLAYPVNLSPRSSHVTTRISPLRIPSAITISWGFSSSSPSSHLISPTTTCARSGVVELKVNKSSWP